MGELPATGLPPQRRLIGLLLGVSLAALPVQAATEVNDANQAELEMVPGIGPQLSEQILAARHQRPFLDWQDFVARLSGVGPKRATRLSAGGLTVAGRPWQPAGSPASAPIAMPPNRP